MQPPPNRTTVRDTPAGQIQLHVRSAGPDDGPALLCIAGLGQQIVAWPDELIGGLAARGVRAITFDNRDQGESTRLHGQPALPASVLVRRAADGTLEPGPYSLTDMADDGVAVLDVLGVDRAHVMGMSMGGMIAQRLAIAHPGRVASLISVMSTTGDPALPGPTPAAGRALLEASPTDDRQGYVEANMAKRAVLGSPGHAQAEDLAERFGEVFDRGLNPKGFLRQYQAILADGDRAAALARLTVRAMVIHGADDPLIRVDAGRATAAALSGSTLEVIDGMGHDLPPAVCEQLVDLLVPWVTEAA